MPQISARVLIEFLELEGGRLFEDKRLFQGRVLQNWIFTKS